MGRLLKALGRLHDAFYRGPDWMQPPEIAGLGSGYRSPSLLVGVWIAGLLSRVLSPAGLMLSGLMVAIAMYSTVIPKNNVAMLLFAMIGFYAADFFAAWLMKPKLKIRRSFPDRVKAGCELELRYVLSNRRRLPAWDITLDSGIPSKALLFAGDENATAACVPARGEARLSVRMRAPRRGSFLIPRPMAESGFPFRIFKRSCRDGVAQSLTVHPDFKSLDSLRMPGGPRLQKMGLAAVSKVGESMEFHGCREFRTGDDPRKMHWLGTARTGEPVVKEFQEERLNRVALVLDTHCPDQDGFISRLIRGESAIQKEIPVFEAAVSLTAAIAEHLAKDEFIIDLFATGKKTWRFRSGRSLAQLDDLLDILSCVDPSFEEPFEDGCQALLEELSAIGAVIVVLSSADAKAEELCRKVVESGAGLRALLVSESQGPAWAETIAPDDIVSGRATRL